MISSLIERVGESRDPRNEIHSALLTPRLPEAMDPKTEKRGQASKCLTPFL